MNSLSGRHGVITTVCTSRGGIPKLPVESEMATFGGLSQDAHEHEKHVQPHRAVLLMDEELIVELAGEGYALRPGAIGENLTIRGLNSQSLPPGVRLRCSPDGPLLEITEARKPCYVLDQIDRSLKTAVRGRAGIFTRVLEPGRVFPQQSITVVSAPLRAGILIGGQNSRMGRAKHTLKLGDGKTMLEHACSVARPHVMDIQLLGAASDLPESLRTLRQLQDARPDCGPLAGLASLLKSLTETCGPAGGWGMLLGCDMPRLSNGPLLRLWSALTNGLSEDFDAAAFASDNSNRLHACCALYHTRVLPAVLAELEAGRSIQRVFKSVRTQVLSITPQESEALLDADTPEAFAALTGVDITSTAD